MTKAERREKKRQNKLKMKIDGSSVKELQKIKIDLPERFYSR